MSESTLTGDWDDNAGARYGAPAVGRVYPRAEMYRPEPMTAAELTRRMQQQRRIAAYEDSLLRPALDWGRIALALYALVGWGIAFALLVNR